MQLTLIEAVISLFVPLLAPARECIDLIRANRESGETKAKTEAKLLNLWNRAMEDHTAVTVDDCRAIQDRILGIRQTNAHIPDWLDNLRRNRHEELMQHSADHLIEEAVQRGRTI